MVRLARCKPLLEQDLVVQADSHHLPFDANTFDNVICFAAFPHFDDPDLALFEMARVARSGARVVIAHLLSREELARHRRMQHREVGQVLEQVLTSGFEKPPRVLDIGCSDAREISEILKRVSVKENAGSPLVAARPPGAAQPA
jgi:hypothetical protein